MDSMLEYLREETREELTENILPYWMENCLDPAGGFYGRIKGNGEVVPDSPRGGILNARILWTFASAYRLTGREEYLMTAMRARDEILNKFFDDFHFIVFFNNIILCYKVNIILEMS